MALKSLVEYIAKSLVDHPEQVNVNEVEGEKNNNFRTKRCRR